MENEKTKKNHEIVYALAFPFSVIFTLGAAIFLGVILDNFFHTKPLFLIIFIVLALFTVYYKVIKRALK